ncbi:Domain in Tre-2, BUB2p, and Cdc16p putative Rab-GAPs [Teratosphaeria destructans]|uniref:Domain in Tre-2, BUB2p, and Cdc16p putative Rab-GAPs n=1 Tax=Teratosphaeria destructans TaxID=418781 RepID=A0A9W7W597_9PEZI|nr:Domain in Tre-2, BUB2p, and Cdc16p putative Rab-GAPs [Teratosphaeria destructans]
MADMSMETASLTDQFTSSPSIASQQDDQETPTLEELDTPILETPAIEDQPSSEHVKGSTEVRSRPVSPITPAEAAAFPDARDSMASIALSDTSMDYENLSPDVVKDVLATPKVRQSRHMRKPSSLEILQNAWPPRPGLERQSTLFDTTKDLPLDTPITPYEERGYDQEPNWEEEASGRESATSMRSESTLNFPARGASLNSSDRASGSSGEEQVDWLQLEKIEAQEKEDKEIPDGQEDESTAFLLARLEQENAKISAFEKSKSVSRGRSESRPPSMGHLKKLVQDRSAPSIRYSLAVSAELDTISEPPPMTELEFWAALVQDYPSTATRLPTLTTTKIRAGIPPPLRGVVWTSMAGARDRNLERAFENLLDEKSPYEGIINKDVGRSFPGVELFRDAEGEGQKMLGRVLNCFSLHDKDIGYCQGLGFLVGPLLMNMGERDAFCVLVRLMDHYSLRASFLPSLSGLHMRIFQFSSLMKQHQPDLSAHLAEMGIEPAYLSQWFLSCFAVSCPLPLLFRIYDVVFAEGANETVMRVALALMRRNEEKMLAATEFEEVMSLLLGRAIWDSYGCDADALVDDFTSLGGLITHARLAELEKEFENQSTEIIGEKAGFLPDVQAAASRFLGRLWAPSHSASKSTSTLSPHSAEKDGPRPHSFLRRTASKQSISTLNGSDGSSGSGTVSMASTAPTDADTHDVSRESQADTMSLKSGKHADSLRTVSMSTGHGIPGLRKEERDMHGQIEDLLTALSELQREHQQLAAMLQKEREERSDDHRVVRLLVKHLRKGDSADEVEAQGEPEGGVSLKADRRRTLPPPPKSSDGPDEAEVKQRPRSMIVKPQGQQEREEVNELISRVHERLNTNARYSASFETKAQLRSTLARTREQLVASENSCRDLTARLETAESAVAAFTSESEDLRSEVQELRIRVNEEFKARQKLEHTISELKAEARSIDRKNRDMLQRTESMEQPRPSIASRRASSGSPAEGVSLARKASIVSAPVSMIGGSGLRELKLGRRDSASSVQSLRSIKTGQPIPAIQTERPASTLTITSTSPDLEEDDTQEEVTSDQPTPDSASPAHTAPPALSPRLVPPAGPAWHARTSSLATKEVFATPQHEVVPDEALLLELVNAKTAEAQARQEVDEMRRSLTLQTRKHDVALAQLRAEIETSRTAAETARLEASQAYAAAEAARAEAVAKAEAAAKLFLVSSSGGARARRR